MKKNILLILLLIAVKSEAQIVLYSQNFNTGSTSEWSLNSSDLGGDTTISDNVWTINNVYNGLIGTTTPDEPSSIIGFPESYYLHIYSILGVTYGFNNNDIYDGADTFTHFVFLNTPITTTGYSNVTFSFYWICNGDSSACGKVYYRTSSSGSWNQITSFLGSSGSTFYGSGSTWTKDSVHLSEFDGQSFLEFAFEFKDGFSGNDPAFGIDDIRVIALNSSTLPLISGANDLCVGSTTTFTDSTSGGSWSASNDNATVDTSGVVAGVSAGVDTISYTVGGISVTSEITINSLPNAGSISGTGTVCIGSSITLIDTLGGGTWSSVSTSVATIDSNGIVTGVSAGTDSIKYTITNGCGSAVANLVVTVNALPDAGGITGSGIVCVGSITTVHDTVSGGIWSSITTGIATIDSNGIVTGVGTGVDSIEYTITNNCGTTVANLMVTVNPLPNAGTITGIDSICPTTSSTLADAATGGLWSTYSSGSIVHVSGGVITGVVLGVDTVYYSVANSCGTAIAKKPTFVVSLPNPGTISGADSVCLGSTATLTDAVSGGIWSIANSNALLTGNVVAGMVPGLDTVTYSVSNVCATRATKKYLHILPNANGGTIYGIDSVCIGASVTLHDTTAGGSWSVNNTNAMNSGNVITGISAGSDIVSYSVLTFCGVGTATKLIHIMPHTDSGTVTSTSSEVCVNATIGVFETVTAGTWSLKNNHLSFASGDTVVGMSAGIDTVVFTVTGYCGTASSFLPVTVAPLPNPGVISGPDSVCVNSSITLTDPVTGGIWFRGSLNDTVIGNGIVVGLHSGWDSIVYDYGNSCGDAIAKHYVNILPLPNAGSITGADTVCIGSPLTLTDANSGGLWLSINARATVTTGGIVTGISAGIDSILYVIHNSCGYDTATKRQHIGNIPAKPTVSGLGIVCIGGAYDTLYGTPLGGTWSKTNAKVTFVAPGIISAVTAGTDIIIYTVSNYCGNSADSITINVQTGTDCNLGVTAEAKTGESRVVVYPNPTTGTVTVEMPNTASSWVTVTDMYGKVVNSLHTDGTTGSLQLDLSNQAAGLYLIRIANENTFYSVKLILDK